LTDPAVDRRGLVIRLERLLAHANLEVVVTVIDSLRALGDRTVHGRVLGLLGPGPVIVRARALIYLRVLFPDSALPLLLDALQDPDSTVRFTAVDQLDELEQFTDRGTFERCSTTPMRTYGGTRATSSTTIFHDAHVLDRVRSRKGRVFPELDALSLPALQARFRAAPPEDRPRPRACEPGDRVSRAPG